MSQPSSDNLITINLDGREVEVPKGMNLIDASKMHGVEIPHYCYHPKLSVSGNCRMCLIEMGTPGIDRATGQPLLNADGSPKILWVPKPVIACATNVSAGMHVRTQSDTVKECREGVMEFLLVNHPLDCPICDQAGECSLQEFATDYGRGYSRFIEKKNVKPKRTRIGPRVVLDDERCILCSRCVRFAEEFIGDHVLGFVDRGSYSTLTTFPGRELESNYSLNTVDICPVGALTSSDFRFKMRVWFLRETPSIDAESSVGCNTLVSSREGKIYRITPRQNDLVNDTWMPDSGRILYQGLEAEDRMVQYAIDGKPCRSEEALAVASTLLQNGQVAVVGSAHLSVEEQFLLAQIRDAMGASIPTYLVSHYGEGDGKLLSADRSPNLRGALLTGLIDALPEDNLNELGAKIDSGEINTVLCVGEKICAAGLTSSQLKKASVIFLGSSHCDTSQFAKIEIPLLTVFEKSGTFVNQQFRVQKFAQAVPGPAGVLFGFSNLTKLHQLLVEDSPFEPSPVALWKHLAQAIPEFAGMDFNTLPDTGTVVSDERFAGLPFVDGPSLHFAPRKEAAKA